ncbi:hypothetical protein Ahy_A10g049491 [Arachis hypogaea]|uniref:Ubiquitin-like protease family profile domain-containing protein n=1 Tax=Arachis hypogaea TaxID=3818 RepID=A0A445B798_ARAHY|nr:hypothetical protein Ahy_A10g049491 [Arachis hypogaea]
MMVVRVETQSRTEALSIVLIQVYLPLSQTTHVPEIELTPANSLIRYMSSCNNPIPEDTAALMMMARTTSYIPKEGLMPSFSLGLTDSRQEEAAMQEGQKVKTPKTPKLIEQLGELVEKIASSGVKTEGKSPQIQKQSGEESFEKFETPVRTNEISAEMKEKCYVWATRVKTYGDGSTNEYDAIVSAMCLIFNQQNVKRFQEEIYPKTKKPFRVEDYPMFVPFLDLKKLESHPYIFAPVCYSNYWWLWVADARKRKFYILDPYHKKCPFDARMNLNKFIVRYVISRMRVYAGRAPLKRKDQEIEPPHINISCQKTMYKSFTLKINLSYIYDCAIYDDVDHYRVEYASRILFHEMNQDKAEAIRESDTIRLCKPSSLLLSPYCQIDSNDIDTD